MSPAELKRAWGLWIAAFALAAAVFTFWPRVDIWFSDLFRDPVEGFRLAASPVLEIWRDLVWNLSIALFLLASVGLIAALFKRQLLHVGARVWGFIVLLYLLGPIILVNEVLKEHWGRARPANVMPLGGTQDFTPALIPANACDSNCSFVSGEGSAAVALGIAMLALLPAVSARWQKAARSWTWAAFAIPVLTLMHRIVTGRHFLSDSVFAALFMIAIALLLLLILKLPRRQS